MKPIIVCTLFVLSAAMGGCGDDATPTAPTPTRTSPVTETFSSNLVAQGSVWRIVTAAQAGTLTATLTTTNQPAAVVGIALGVRAGSGTSCLLNSTATDAAGAAPRLSAQVDAGDYCVKLFDVGTLATPMSFTLTIVYP